MEFDARHFVQRIGRLERATPTSGTQNTLNSTSFHQFRFPGSTPSVSAAGAQDGIVWAMDTSRYCTNQSPTCGPTVLYAHDASNIANELWNSSEIGADADGFAVKFAVHTIANGKVYVGTSGNNKALSVARAFRGNWTFTASNLSVTHQVRVPDFLDEDFPMDRFTISLDEKLAAAFDQLIKDRGYATRSEAVRDILRSHLQLNEQRRNSKGSCIAALSYVYNHHERELSERLANIQHEHHTLTISTMHAHLDHDECIETVLLKGPIGKVRQFADAMTAETGVRHGQINLISVDLTEPHSHGGSTHRHLRPSN